MLSATSVSADGQRKVHRGWGRGGGGGGGGGRQGGAPTKGLKCSQGRKIKDVAFASIKVKRGSSVLAPFHLPPVRPFARAPFLLAAGSGKGKQLLPLCTQGKQLLAKCT